MRGEKREERMGRWRKGEGGGGRGGGRGGRRRQGEERTRKDYACMYNSELNIQCITKQLMYTIISTHSTV